MDNLFDHSRARRANFRVIAIRGAREHNLKNVDLEIPRDQLVVFTGLSGSGKSSLAFDTIYAEGQRRYVESPLRLCAPVPRNDAEAGRGSDRRPVARRSPSSKRPRPAIRAPPSAPSPRSTTTCGFSGRAWAFPIRPATGPPIESQTVSQMVDRVLALPEGTRLYLLAPVVRGRKGEYRKELAEYMKRGFQRVKIDGDILRDCPGAGAGQEAQARHRCGGRSSRGEAGPRYAACELARNGAQARRGIGGGGACRRGRSPPKGGGRRAKRDG